MNLISELRADLLSTKLLSALSVGLVVGIIGSAYLISMGALVFSGPLAPFLSQGTIMVVFGGFIVCLVIALTSGYRGALSMVAVPSVMVLVAIGSTIGVQEDALAHFMTTATVVIVGSVATGICFLLVGYFRLAKLIQFIPYSVAGGFIAGTGVMLCTAALSLMGVTLETLPTLLEPASLWRWGPGAAYGLGLVLVTKRWNSHFILPASLLLAAVLYHLVFAVVGMSGEEARAAGLLFAGTATGGLWPPFELRDLTHVDWAEVAAQVPNVLTLIVVTLIAVTMHLSGLELATNAELDWNREFRAAGGASVIAGLGGGSLGNILFPLSILSHRFRANTRLAGIVTALVVGSVVLLGDSLLNLVPLPLIAGSLLFLGLDLLDEWIVRSLRRSPWAEYAILLLIAATIVSFGFLEGVGVGMVITTVFFAVRLSRVGLIEASFTARGHHSKRIRPIPDRAILRTEGERIQGYCLRGYMFFGSVGPLIDRLKQSWTGDRRPDYILLDFGGVSGFDFSAISGLCRFAHAARSAGVRVVFCALAEELKNGLARNLPASVYDDLRFEPNADRALEHCEDRVLAARRADQHKGNGWGDGLLERVAGDMERHLDRQVLFEAMVDELQDWLEPRDYDAGEAIVSIGEQQNGLQLLVRGQASAYDAKGTWLFQYGPGGAIEPRSAFGAYAAETAMIADQPCRTMTLPPAARLWLEENEEQLILKLYRYLVTS
ncbi:MAG: SulP family inorganic anion transporter [Rhodospirillales bacterium]|nr:SulP family inorganic anion transporter [Rhodospirillales bacterium]